GFYVLRQSTGATPRARVTYSRRWLLWGGGLPPQSGEIPLFVRMLLRHLRCSPDASGCRRVSVFASSRGGARMATSWPWRGRLWLRKCLRLPLPATRRLGFAGSRGSPCILAHHCQGLNGLLSQSLLTIVRSWKSLRSSPKSISLSR